MRIKIISVSRPIAIACAFLALVGCKADELQIALTASDIYTAASGDGATAKYEAVFTQFGELDSDQRTQIEAVENIVYKYLNVDDFELETTDNGFKVTIEGEMALSNEKIDDAYYLQISNSDIFSDYLKVQLVTGDNFDTLKSEISAISFMLAPDVYHPTKFKLKADGVTVIAPGVEVDATAYMMFKDVIRRKVSMLFNGGIYEDIGAGFYISK